MELRNIKSFIKVAEFENFSKAAEVLGYAHNPPSPCNPALEQEFGCVNCSTASASVCCFPKRGAPFFPMRMIWYSWKRKQSKLFPKYHPYRHPAHRHD